MSVLSSVRAIDDRFSVSPQLPPEAMADVAAAGFRSVVNNRPDHEGGAAQPTSDALAAAAMAAGLRYAHLPVQPSVQTPSDVAAFAALLADLPPPILAFCRSGARSTKLYLAATGQG